MSRTAVTSMCRRCQTRYLTSTNINSTTTTTRSYSSTLVRQQEDDVSIFAQALRKPNTAFRPQSQSQQQANARNSPSDSNLEFLAQGARNEASTRPSSGVSDSEPYHLNVFTHKRNTHITFTEPSRNPILSFSAGNIGLRKAQRGSFDAAYQLCTYTMRKMVEKQWRLGGKAMTMNKMMTLNEAEVRERGIEIILRGYGPGREAFQKALLGNEGKILKPLIKKVTDGTRLKFGGVRSPAVRRLG